MPNPFTDDKGNPTVSMTEAGENLSNDLKRLMNGLGNLDEILNPEDNILLKPNINSWHESPAAVDPGFLTSFIDFLRAEGYSNLTVAECSGRHWAPTEKVVEKKGLLPLLKERRVPFVNLENVEWKKFQTGGQHLPEVHLPKILGDYDKLIFTPNLKTHGNTGFTVALKLAMGLTPLKDREKFHQGSVSGAVADLARVVWPDLVVVDGRKAFIDGGPTFGTAAEPGVLLACGDPVACDIQAVKVLQQWGAQAHLGTSDPYECELIAHMKDKLPEDINLKEV